MFKPATMSRIRLIIHKKYFDNVVSALQDIGVMQIESLPEEVPITKGEGLDYKQISDYAQRFRGLESLLYPLGVQKLYTFHSIDELISQANGVIIDQRVTTISKELDSIETELTEISSKLGLLQRLGGFKHDMAILSTKNVVSFIAYGHQLEQLREEVRTKLKNVSVIDIEGAAIFSARRTEEKDFSAVAEKANRVTFEVIPQMKGTIHSNISALEHNRSGYLARKKSLQAELASISEKWYPLVSAIREQLDIEMEKVEIANKLGTTASIVAIEGWIPTEEIVKVDGLIKRITDNRYILEHVRTKDRPPTKMENPVTARLYEFFIRFYSIPKSNEIDPTIMFAVVFPIFFGFMVGDAGYGLFILVLAIWLVHHIDHPPKKSWVPKAISGFVSRMITMPSLKILAKSIIPGAILAILLGVLFNEWFGFHAPYTTPFNVEMNLPTLLNTAGWIGVFMVCFGFILGFLNKWANGDHHHAYAKIGWLLAAVGVVIFGLNILHKAVMGPSNPIALASYALLAVGIGIITKFEGLNGLMELPSLVSHMLSYTRLVGILLASVILAEVIDLIFMKSLNSGNILLGFVGILILFIGQAFNIIIAMFEPGIQGARLIYVEFFSKFFEGNGKQFKPFSTQRRHTLTRFKL